MRKLDVKLCIILMFAIFCFGCGHTHVCNVGLMSFGDLEGKTIPENPKGPILEGTVALKIFTQNYYLSDALRDALKNSEYDTLVNAEVTTETSLFVTSNEIRVKGTALDSKKLSPSGGAQ